MCWCAEILCAPLLAGVLAAGASPPPVASDTLASHVTVDEARFHRRPAPPQPPTRVTRADYLSLIQDFHRQYAKPRIAWLRSATPPANPDAHLETAEYFAFAYRTTGNERAAERAVAFVHQAHSALTFGARKDHPVRPNWQTPIHADRIWRWIAASRAFSERAREDLRELMVAAQPRFPEQWSQYVAQSRWIGLGAVGECLLHYVPDAPDARRWREFVDYVWDEFRRFDDTANNTGNYNAAFFLYLIDWVRARGAEDEVYNDPDIHRFFERYMLQVLPLGTLPHYGDTTGWNVEWGSWILVFEVGARITGDGRFRWAAHRLFRYGVERIEDLSSWSYTGTRAVLALMEAYLVADEAIDPTPPTQDLVVLMRHGIERSSGSRWHYVLRADMIPSKIVFRSDTSVQSMALMLDLTPDAVHNTPSAPSNLVALVDHGAALLMDQGYNEREVEYHNALLLEDFEGFPLHPERQSAKILASAVVGPLLYAAFRIENYSGYPADLERRVVFARNRAILVVDRLHFRKSFRARLGPVYNLRTLGPEIGEEWVNSYIGDFVPVRGIGKNQPILARWKNPARDLLIRFLPVSGGELDIFDRIPEDATIPLPYRVQYRSRTTARAGETVTFGAVLLPHAPIRHPSALAADIRFVEHGEDGSVAASVPLDHDGSVWLSAGPIDADAFSTDAEAAAVVMKGDRVDSLGLAAGSRLEVAGTSILDESTRADRSR